MHDGWRMIKFVEDGRNMEGHLVGGWSWWWLLFTWNHDGKGQWRMNMMKADEGGGADDSDGSDEEADDNDDDEEEEEQNLGDCDNKHENIW